MGDVPRWTCRRFLVPLVALCLFAGGAPALDRGGPEDLWYAVFLQGQPVGWMRVTTRREPGRIVSEEALSVAIRRGTQSLSLETLSRFAETPEGLPVEAESRQSLGAAAVVRSFRFEKTEVDVEVREGERVQKSRRGAPEGAWLTPAAAQRYVSGEIVRGAREVRYRTVSPEGDLAACEVSMRRVGHEPLEVLGKIVPAVVWDVTTSLLPGVTAREYTDGGARSLRTTMDLLPGVPLTLIRADRDLALAKVSPPEILASTLIAPEGRLASPRSLRRAVYEVRFTGEGRPNLPSTGFQRVEPLDGAWRVTVDLGRPAAGDGVPGDDCRRPSAYVGSDDPEVLRLAREALGGQLLPPAEEAEILRRFVRGFVRTRDLSVGFATAGEVARTAQGDCTEHAVLLAALLRAEGIPSRLVSGLVYLDRFLGREAVFGYHMWTQGWVSRPGEPAQWVDLDATLDESPFDAAHVALATSSLAEGTYSNDLVRFSPLLGRLSIRVVEPRSPLRAP